MNFHVGDEASNKGPDRKWDVPETSGHVTAKFSVRQRLATWARRKYKKLNGHKPRSFLWLRRVAKRRPQLFFHWQLLGYNDRSRGAVQFATDLAISGTQDLSPTAPILPIIFLDPEDGVGVAASYVTSYVKGV